MLRWADDNVRELECQEIGGHYGRYRLHLPEAERAMARSLERYGQLSPVVVCRRQERYELIDGFKRLGAARSLTHISHLSVRLLEADERSAKAAIYGLNRAGGRTRELEEAWIIQALVREDGMSQMEVAELLGRHKSWVCRRLALIERLGPTARDELRVGLLSPTAARQIVRLPEGNQAEVLETIRREALSGAELAGAVDLWLGCAERRQQDYLLRHRREALSQATGALPAAHDPRLSEDGNRVCAQRDRAIALWRRFPAPDCAGPACWTRLRIRSRNCWNAIPISLPCGYMRSCAGWGSRVAIRLCASGCAHSGRMRRSRPYGASRRPQGCIMVGPASW